MDFIKSRNVYSFKDAIKGEKGKPQSGLANKELYPKYKNNSYISIQKIQTTQ